jgi:integrase/recombinase XerD
MKIKLNKNDVNITMKDAFESYQKQSKIRNLSDYTVKYQNTYFNKFMKFIDNDDFLIKDINMDIIDDYILDMMEKGNKPKSINTALIALNAFLHWCMDNNYCERFKTKLVKKDEIIKETYSEEQLKLLLKKPDLEKSSFAQYRNWVIVNYLLSTGNRSNTLLNIKIKDLDLYNQMIKLTTTKSRKQQIIPLSTTLCKILEEYLQYRQGEQEDYLFCSEQGGVQMSRYTLSSAIIIYNRKRGVNLTSLHAFRHTFAKMYILNGGEIVKLQHLMGHADITTTKKYVNLYAKEVQNDYDKLNPLDTLLNSNKKDHVKMKR